MELSHDLPISFGCVHVSCGDVLNEDFSQLYTMTASQGMIPINLPQIWKGMKQNGAFFQSEVFCFV